MLSKALRYCSDDQQLIFGSLAFVPRGSMDPNDHVWLGKMYWDTGDRAKAVAEFRTALDQAGGVPENWINLVQALVASRQFDEAKRRAVVGANRVSKFAAPSQFIRLQPLFGRFLE